MPPERKQRGWSWVRDDGLWTPVLATLLGRSRTINDTIAPASAAASAGVSVRCASYDADWIQDRHLEAIVSLPPAPQRATRTVEFGASTESAARVLAYRTHRDSTLVAGQPTWRENLAVLAEAMRSHQCPKRLVLLKVRDQNLAAEFMAALAVTTAVEEVQVVELPFVGWFPLGQGPNFSQMLHAIRNNVGLRSFTYGGIRRDGVGYSDFVDAAGMMDLWSAVFANGAIERVNVRWAAGDMYFRVGQRTDCGLHVVQLLKSNRIMTHIQYNPDTHDTTIMESQAVPILYLNRLRRLLSSNFKKDDDDDREAAKVNMTPDRILPLLLSRSSAVHKHLMLWYHLLRSNVSAASNLLTSRPDASSAAAASSKNEEVLLLRHSKRSRCS